MRTAPGYDLSDQRGERFDAGHGVAPAMDLGPVDIVGGQAGRRSAAVVVVADPHHPGLASSAWTPLFNGLF